MVNFTMGIVFSPDLKDMYLLRKDHPDWQAGLLNGVGGKLQDGENYASAMARESQEEASYAGDWNHLGSMRGNNDVGAFQCDVFYSVMGAEAKEPKTTEAEKIEKHPVADLVTLIPEMVPHLPMLIMAAQAHHAATNKFTLEVVY